MLKSQNVAKVVAIRGDVVLYPRPSLQAPTEAECVLLVFFDIIVDRIRCCCRVFSEERSTAHDEATCVVEHCS